MKGIYKILTVALAISIFIVPNKAFADWYPDLYNPNGVFTSYLTEDESILQKTFSVTGAALGYEHVFLGAIADFNRASVFELEQLVSDNQNTIMPAIADINTNLGYLYSSVNNMNSVLFPRNTIIDNSSQTIWHFLKTISQNTSSIITNISTLSTNMTNGLTNIASSVDRNTSTVSAQTTAINNRANEIKGKQDTIISLLQGIVDDGIQVDVSVSAYDDTALKTLVNSVISSLDDIATDIGTSNAYLSSIQTSNSNINTKTGNIYTRLADVVSYLKTINTNVGDISTNIKTMKTDLSTTKTYASNAVAKLTQMITAIEDKTFPVFDDSQIIEAIESITVPSFDDSNIVSSLNDIYDLLNSVTTKLGNDIHFRVYPYSWNAWRDQLYYQFDNIIKDLSKIIGLISVPEPAVQNQIIGQFDWGAFNQRSSDMLDNISELAPFGAIALVAAEFNVIAEVNAITNPQFDMPFKFSGSNNHVVIDLGWLDDARPLFNFFSILMLIMMLTSITMDYVREEATS